MLHLEAVKGFTKINIAINEVHGKETVYSTNLIIMSDDDSSSESDSSLDSDNDD